MKKGLIGLGIGIIITFVVIIISMPKMMLKERVSPYDYSKTVTTIEQAVTNGGWVIPTKMNMQKSLAKHEQEIRPTTLFKICEPQLASTIMNDDEAMKVSVFMPCTIAVYEKSDGKTYVSTMNSGLMGRLFGGTISKVMAGSVAEQTAAFTKFLDE